METLLHLRTVLWNDMQYVLGSVTSWILVAFGHIVGLQVKVPFVLDVLPYFQIGSLTLASIASLYTIYKIRIDLKGKNKN